MFDRHATPRQPGDARSHQHGPLTFDWAEGCRGWISPLPELGPTAMMVIGPGDGRQPPQAASCVLVLQARERIALLNDCAIDYLIAQCHALVLEACAHALSRGSFSAMGMELFEHEQTPDEFSLLYDPSFDPGAVWRVRFRQLTPIAWDFDD